MAFDSGAFVQTLLRSTSLGVEGASQGRGRWCLCRWDQDTRRQFLFLFFGAVFWSRSLLNSSDLPESGMTPCKDHAAQQVLDVLRQHPVACGKLEGVASSEAAKVGFGWCSLNCGWLATVLAWLFSFNRLPEVFQKLLAVHYSDMTEASGPFDACWLCVVAFLQYWSRVTNHDISWHIVTHHMLLQLTVPWNEVHESCAQVRWHGPGQ